MRILYLSNNEKFELFKNYKSFNDDIIFFKYRLKLAYIEEEKIDLIISYNYKYIIKPDVINHFKNRIINLHISYLPFNRGSHPNVWSFLEDTPKGISIHYIDEGIDTGDILLQKEMFFDEDTETFETTYIKLNNEIQKLFLENFQKIKENKITPKKQDVNSGTFHLKKDLDPLLAYFRDDFWKLKISEVKKIVKKNGLMK